MIAVLLGTVFGVAMIVASSLSQKKGVQWRTAIPFGPYMVAGAAALIFFQPQLKALWDAWVMFITPG
jgi:prepilin signal peptidase PulO-like enzyme (type II secretory pathway)